MLSREEWSIPKVEPVKPDVYSRESLIAWLEEQPRDKEYDWKDCNGGCLLDQYARGMGLDSDSVVVFSEMYLHFDAIACVRPMTFGAALDRARSAQRGA